MKEWRIKKGPVYQILHQARSRAKKRGLSFDLTEEDVTIPDICPVFGITLRRNKGRGFHPDSPSLDRIDNSKGYTKDNVRVISNRANLLKCDATLKELELLVADAYRCLKH